MESKKEYFMDCHLAGRKYYDADEVWDKLKLLCSHKKVVFLRRKSNHLTPCFLPLRWRFDTFNGIIVQ